MDPLTLLGIGGSLLSSIFGSNAAAGAVNAGAQQGSDVLRKNFLDSLNLLKPQMDAGNQARGQQLNLLGLGNDPNGALAAVRSQPGYGFGLSNGVNAVNQGNANGGTFFSGARDKELTKFGHDYADQQFGNYFNRLGGLSGAGAAATGQAVGAGGQAAAGQADLAYRGGDATASSYLTGAKGVNNGINSLLQMYYSKPGGSSVNGNAFDLFKPGSMSF